MSGFTPLSAAIGGALIGLAATLLILLVGRIAGISGILAGCLDVAGDNIWRLAFITGLILAPVVTGLFGYTVPTPAIPAGWGVIVVAGVLVGFGARLGGGCTSGHGVCGMARFSSRSIVATLTFMGTAMAVVALTRHVLGG